MLVRCILHHLLFYLFDLKTKIRIHIHTHTQKGVYYNAILYRIVPTPRCRNCLQLKRLPLEREQTITNKDIKAKNRDTDKFGSQHIAKQKGIF
jgi:hypothetical protein